MSWLFSRALVEEYLGDTSLDGEQSVQSNGNHTQQAYCAPDKMTDFSRLSRFGMTYKPLTENRGEELLTLYLEAFHAKTSQPLEREQGLTESEAECGEKWHGSFTKYDPSTSLWKTHQCSLLGDLESYLETWPKWGLMRNGECWEQTQLEPLTNETEFGLPDGETFFHTPNTTGLDGGSNSRKALRKRQEKIPTPQARDWKGSSGRSLKGLEYDLPTHVKMWPTPCTRDWKDTGENVNWEAVAKKGKLAGAVMWTTPVADDTSHRKNKYAQGGTALSTQAGGKLNPTWVEWLMGWPLGWTDLKPLETDKFQRWLDAHGKA